MIIKTKILLHYPILYELIIKDFVENDKYESVTHFIKEAIKEKLEREYGSLAPKTVEKFEDWGWDEEM